MMENSNSPNGPLTTVTDEIKGPRGGIIFAGVGIILAILGCGAISVGSLGSLETNSNSAVAAIGGLLFCFGGIIGFFGLIGIGVGAVIGIRYALTNKPAVPSHPASGFTSTLPTNYSAPLSLYSAVPVSRGLSIDQRREILQREVRTYVSRGYRVVSQTDTTAQLVRPKRFSCLWFLIWALLLIGWVFYLAWYWSKRDEQIYIEVDERGRIHRRN